LTLHSAERRFLFLTFVLFDLGLGAVQRNAGLHRMREFLTAASSAASTTTAAAAMSASLS
jgi:hypothetical protein